MTQKDFEVLAKALASVRPILDRRLSQWLLDRAAIAKGCKELNPV